MSFHKIYLSPELVQQYNQDKPARFTSRVIVNKSLRRVYEKLLFSIKDQNKIQTEAHLKAFLDAALKHQHKQVLADEGGHPEGYINEQVAGFKAILYTYLEMKLMPSKGPKQAPMPQNTAR